jgi:hypothetical protein
MAGAVDQFAHVPVWLTSYGNGNAGAAVAMPQGNVAYRVHTRGFSGWSGEYSQETMITRASGAGGGRRLCGRVAGLGAH